MISGIVCVDKHWAIGKKGGLLFKLPADLKFFKEKTKGHIVVMGYNTYMSLPEKNRPLPGRINVVLWDKASNTVETKDDIIFFNNFKVLLSFVKILSKEFEVFICGGGMLYKAFLPYYDRVYVTKVNAIDTNADTFFPDLDEDKNFKCIDCPDYVADCESGYSYQFTTYERIK